MRTLILPTSSTPHDATSAIAAGQRPRIDYLDLQTRFDADLVDFHVYQRWPVSWLEKPDRWLRLAWGQALVAWRHWRGYDVVYSLGEDVGIPLAFLLRLRRWRPRHIMVVHNVLSPKKVPIIRALGVMPSFARVVALTSDTSLGICDTYHLAQSQVVFVRDAIDQQFWQSTNGDVDPRLVISVGRAKRDYGTLLAAVEGMPLRLRIQADSQWFVAYSNEQDRKALPDNVELGPYLTFLELRALYDRAAFVVIPLQAGAHHSAGTVSIKEAMAMGKAVIVASRGSVEDYVRHGETGLLVPPGDAAALREAIGALLQQPEQARRMGKAGRALLETEMRYEDKIDRLAALSMPT